MLFHLNSDGGYKMAKQIEAVRDFLQHVDGTVYAICETYYQRYLKDSPDSQENFRIFCEEINYIQSDKRLKLDVNGVVAEYERLYNEQKETVELIVNNLESKNESENEFYIQLWEQWRNETLFPTDEKRIAMLIQLVGMDEIPYYQLSKVKEMSDKEYENRTNNIILQLKRAIYVINSKYTQKTQVATQLIEIESQITDEVDKVVFLAQIMGYYEKQCYLRDKTIERLKKKHLELENE